MSQQESDEYYDYQEILIDPKQEPIRIDKFLMDRLPKVSRNRVQNAIRAGSITVDKKEIKPNFKVKPGHVINLVLPRRREDSDQLLAQDIPLDIIYEDDDLLVVNKEAGMVVHPGVGNPDGTLVNALAYHLQDTDLPVLEGNSDDRVGLVHRIDKDTSGLLVIAKNDFTMTHLAKQFFQHTIERKYQALVWGEPDPHKGTITGNVGRHPRFRLQHTVFPEGEQGKEAITHYEVIEPLYYVSLLECQLETGRTHQIRVHMKHIGHTLFNDERYGGNQILKGTVYSKFKTFVQRSFEILPRQALHAKSLGFVHPVTGEKMYFEAPLPEDFAACLDRWRNYVTDKRSKNNL